MQDEEKTIDVGDNEEQEQEIDLDAVAPEQSLEEEQIDVEQVSEESVSAPKESAEPSNVQKDELNEYSEGVNKRIAKDFNSLVKFIDTADYTITQQRDSSYMEFNETYQIDMLTEVKIIDTLGTVSVKDSLFKNSNLYKSFASVPVEGIDVKFEINSNNVVIGFSSKNCFWHIL